jgi:hypothetical protein
MLGLEFEWRILQNPQRVNMSTDKLRVDWRWKGFLIGMQSLYQRHNLAGHLKHYL